MSLLDDWHLDKRVPVGIIAAIAIQTGSLIWFLAGVDGRLQSVEVRTVELELEARDARIERRDNATNVAVINQSLMDIKASLGRIENEVISNRNHDDK